MRLSGQSPSHDAKWASRFPRADVVADFTGDGLGGHDIDSINQRQIHAKGAFEFGREVESRCIAVRLFALLGAELGSGGRASGLARMFGRGQALEVGSELFVAQLDLLLEMIVSEQLLG